VKHAGGPTWEDRAVLRTIVEGEPGIFPEPVARLMRGIGGLFRRKPTGERPRPEDADGTGPGAAPDDDGGRRDGGPRHSGDST
jgi:hypothetical protein